MSPMKGYIHCFATFTRGYASLHNLAIVCRPQGALLKKRRAKATAYRINQIENEVFATEYEKIAKFEIIRWCR